MSAPPAEDALRGLAELLRADDSVISPHVGDPDVEPVLGLLAAAGPRAAAKPGSYALLVEATREGYLLHYGEPRIVRDADPDLALLAGDYLYATGLERLAALGDLEAVRELSDLISLSAQIHNDRPDDGGDEELATALWLASTVAVACGTDVGHEEAKRAAREGETDAAAALWGNAALRAEQVSLRAPLEAACDAIGFAAQNLPERG